MSGQRGASIRPHASEVEQPLHGVFEEYLGVGPRRRGMVLHGKAAMVDDQTCTPRFAFAEPYKKPSFGAVFLWRPWAKAERSEVVRRDPF